jgi:hypothetical protein
LKSLIKFTAMMLLASTGLSEVIPGLSARATLTRQRTCHTLDAVSLDLELNVSLHNDTDQKIDLCDVESYVSLTPRLSVTEELATANQYVYNPIIDTFPSDKEVAQEKARLRHCYPISIPAHSDLELKRGQVARIIWVDNPPRDKPLSGVLFFTADVNVRTKGAKNREWKDLPLTPLAVTFPPLLTPEERAHFIKIESEDLCDPWVEVSK